MEYFYSETTNGFYVEGIHSEIPEDSIAISAERHAQLIDELSIGKIINIGADGLPKAIDAPDPTVEELSEIIRSKRNELLLQSDWMASQDRVMSQEEKDYRQALRDITDQDTFPQSVTWPELA